MPNRGKRMMTMAAMDSDLGNAGVADGIPNTEYSESALRGASAEISLSLRERHGVFVVV